MGTWLFGILPQTHKPAIWVEREDAEKAAKLLAQYEQDLIERQAQAKEPSFGTDPIAVVCEECGRKSEFPANQRGTIQNCPFCRAYVDVGEMDLGGDFSRPTDDDDTEPGA